MIIRFFLKKILKEERVEIKVCLFHIWKLVMKLGKIDSFEHERILGEEVKLEWMAGN